MATALLLLLLPFSAAVDDQPLCLEARGMYDSMDLEGALARFELVLLIDSLTEDERAQVLLWIGLAEADLGRFDNAETRFAEALRLDPDARLPVEASPRVQELMEAAREKARESAPDPEDEDAPVADVTKNDDGTVVPRGPGVLIPSSGRARDAYGNEVPDDPSNDSAASPWLAGAGWAGVAAGAVAVIGGAGLAGFGVYEGSVADGTGLETPEAQATLARAQLEQISGAILVLAGAATAAVGTALLIVGFSASE